MPTLAEQLQSRLAQIDQQIARTKSDAQQAVIDLQGTRQTLLTAAQTLAKVPEAEQIIPALKALGLL